VNKQSYLNELQNHLKSNNVEDIGEIIAEYDEHFSRKTADGYTEDEIAAKLGKPKEIALQFTPADNKTAARNGSKVLTGIGLSCADLAAVPFFIVMYAWVLVLAAAAAASVLCGIGLLIKPLLPDMIFLPPMPYLSGALFGLMMLAFGVLAAAAALYSGALTRQMGKTYLRWHKNASNGGKYPPYSMHPILKDQLRRRLRSIGLIALVVFGAAFVIGFIASAANAGAFGFWHVWHWFQ
jgi:uncharacterized membrane protein